MNDLEIGGAECRQPADEPENGRAEVERNGSRLQSRNLRNKRKDGDGCAASRPVTAIHNYAFLPSEMVKAVGIGTQVDLEKIP